MGARISAHLANAGVPSYLLDIVPPDADGPTRNRIAAAGLEAAVKSKPAAFFKPSLARLVTVGNFEDDLQKLAEVDWIIEAVVEDMEIKRDAAAQDRSRSQAGHHHHDQHQRPARGQDRRRLLRRLPPLLVRHALLQSAALHAPAGADPHARHRSAPPMEAIAHFCDLHLGKGVVYAKDTPNFIANRIGIFSMLNVMRLMQEMDLSVEEVDALTGTAVGWPKTATFRLGDLVGLDILGHVVRNSRHQHQRRAQRPDAARLLQGRCWSASGWATRPSRLLQEDRRRTARARSSPSTGRRWSTGPSQRPKFPALEMAKNVDDLPERAAHAAGAVERQGQHLPVVGALRPVDLRGEPHRRDRRLRGRNRSRHEAGLQLGDGAVRAVGCGRRRQDREAHEGRRQAGRRRTSRSCSPRATSAGTPTTPRLPAAARTST